MFLNIYLEKKNCICAIVSKSKVRLGTYFITVLVYKTVYKRYQHILFMNLLTFILLENTSYINEYVYILISIILR